MAPEFSRNYVKIRYLGDSVVKISRDELHDHFPTLWSQVKSGLVLLTRFVEGIIDVNHDTLVVVWKYLKDIEQYGASTALNDGLEDAWDAESHPYRKDYTKNLFRGLCSLFHPQYFGCSDRVFKTMVSFFERHCSDIMSDTYKDNWLSYLESLDHIKDQESKHISDAVYCILRYGFQDQGFEDRLQQSDLSRTTINRFRILLQARGASRISNPFDRGSWMDSSLTSRYTPTREVGYHGLSLPIRPRYERGSTYEPGSSYTAEELQRLCYDDPDSILVSRGACTPGREYGQEVEYPSAIVVSRSTPSRRPPLDRVASNFSGLVIDSHRRASSVDRSARQASARLRPIAISRASSGTHRDNYTERPRLVGHNTGHRPIGRIVNR